MFTATAISAQKENGFLCNWESVAELPPLNRQPKALGIAGPVCGIDQNKLIVAGGANFPDSMPWQGGKKKYYNTVYVYEKKDSKITLLQQQFALPFNIAYAACCSTPSGIVVAGGENETGISKKVFLLQWDKNKSAVSNSQLPELPVAISNAAATVFDNTVYIAGGETATAVSNQLLAMDLNNTGAGWKQLALIPKAVSFTVFTALPNNDSNCLYLIGGRKKNSNGISDFYSSVFQFNISKNQWSEKTRLPYPLSAGTGTVAGSNEIVVFGGDKGKTFHTVETLIAAINSEKDEIKKQDLILQKNKIQSSHPGFSKEVLMYNIITDSWKPVCEIPFETPVTTTAVQWGDQIIISSGEIKAGVRSPDILSVKISPQSK